MRIQLTCNTRQPISREISHSRREKVGVRRKDKTRVAQRAARDASDNHVAVAEPNVRTTRSAALILCRHPRSRCAHQGPSALAYEPADMWRLTTVLL